MKRFVRIMFCALLFGKVLVLIILSNQIGTTSDCAPMQWSHVFSAAQLLFLPLLAGWVCGRYWHS